MARLFISHSSADNAAAKALAQWLAEHGWDDVFLDIDPERGLVAGQRWQEALKAAADRCEAVLFLISAAWLASRWCLAEFLLAKNLHKRIFGLIVDPVPLDQVPAEMAAEWQMCELVGPDRLRQFEVEVLGRPAQVAFREAGLDLLRRGLERAGLDAKSFPWPPRDEPVRAPYRGLKALEPQDAAIFFGRDAWIVRGLDRIRGLAERGVERMLVILGASGSGKSSFLRAGLWPRLLRDDLNFLPLPIVRPQTAVISGSTGLVAALSGAFARLGEPRAPGRIREALAEDADGFARLLDELSALAKSRHLALAEPPGDPVIVLPLDQAEELFNPEGRAETAVFVDMLAGLLAPAEGAGLRFLVVATMRSDRLELLQNEPRLEAARPYLFSLPAIPLSEFKSVIEAPARRVAEAGGRLAIDPALTERLIADAAGADALPLLGFTLERLYADYGTEGRLAQAEYESLGGVQGSIEAAIAAALAEPGHAPSIPAERETQFAALRAAFIPWLARIDPESGAPMRRVAHRDEIPEGSRAIVDRLVEARLLVADRRCDGADVVEIAHESLLRQWPALTAWLGADAADLILVEGVERAAAEWQRNGRLDAWLDHRGERLAAADRLSTRGDFRRRLADAGLAYLTACRRRAEDELEQKKAILHAVRPPGRALALALVVVLAFIRIWDPLPLQELRLSAFDIMQWLFPRPSLGDDSPVRIIQIDDETLRRVGQWPWPPVVFAHFMDQIAASRPTVLGIGLMLSKDVPLLGKASNINRVLTRGQPAAKPSEVAEAVAKVPSVSAIELTRKEYSRASSGDQELTSQLPRYIDASRGSSDITISARAVGSINLEPDVDGVFRRVPLVSIVEGKYVPGFAVAVLDVAAGVTESTSLRPGAEGLEIAAGGRVAPADRNGAGRIYFARPLPFYSAAQILEGTVSASELRNKILLLGESTLGTEDLHRTPLGLMYGIEMQAQWIESVLSDRMLVRPGATLWIELAAVLISGLGMIWSARYASPARACVIAAGIVAALIGTELVLFCVPRWLVDFGYPSAVAVATFGGMLLESSLGTEGARRWLAARYSGRA